VIPLDLGISYKTDLDNLCEIQSTSTSKVYTADLSNIPKHAKEILKTSSSSSSSSSNQQTYSVIVKVLGESAYRNPEERLEAWRYEVVITWCFHRIPNVIQFIGYCEQPLCLITKLYQMNLEELLIKAKLPIPPRLSLQFAIDISNGMTHVHGLNIVHHDLTMKNILLEDLGSGDYNAVICGFGFARLIGDASTIKRKMGMGLSVQYCAPEVNIKCVIFSYRYICIISI